MFDCDNYYSFESDNDSWSPSNLYDRFIPGGGYHVVPPPMTGTFMPPKPDLPFAASAARVNAANPSTVSAARVHAARLSTVSAARINVVKPSAVTAVQHNHTKKVWRPKTLVLDHVFR
nr:hypothetical protein [Tanacetum cinerariifolium]